MAAAKPVVYRISAPEASFTGVVGGIAFAHGVYEGEVPVGPLAYFTGAGYSVEEVKATRSSKPKDEADQPPADAPADSPADPSASADDKTTGSK